MSVRTDESGSFRAKVQFGGILKDVSLDLVPEAAVGDYVLVHAGIAIGIVDAEEAARVFELLDELAAIEDKMESGGEVPA